ncbi:DUF421 domain-containing protein [Anditalea andensis]|uniref:Membrane protein n=1 Tax=Anditalea andensis TaxID=1048983 RepID=A0A074LN64_9BACT|nr:YetF domain-containing protein [Anditalea andensis]KEO75357.1 membrane protein [Anditalea andensis]
MDYMFFDTWESLLRTFIITVLAYFSLILMLRLSGKRTLSKMNAFDFTVTVALGSTLAAVSLNKEIPLADGALALGLLISLQFFITWLSVRINFVKSIITSTPSLILYKGEMLDRALRRERITSEEVLAKAREQGYSALIEIDAMILETTGEITIVPHIDHEEAGTLKLVKNFDKHQS